MASNFTKLISQQAQKEEEEKKKSGSASSEIIDILPQPSRSESTADQTYYDKTKDRYLQEDIVSTTTPKVTAKAPSFSASADLDAAFESIQNSSTGVKQNAAQTALKKMANDPNAGKGNTLGSFSGITGKTTFTAAEQLTNTLASLQTTSSDLNKMQADLTKRKAGVDRLQGQLDAQGANLEVLGRDSRLYTDTAFAAKYIEARDQYYRYADLYNTAIEQYNGVLGQYNAAIEQYNTDYQTYKDLAGRGGEIAADYKNQIQQLEDEAAELERASARGRAASVDSETANRLMAQAQAKRDEANKLRQETNLALASYYSILSESDDYEKLSKYVHGSKAGHGEHDNPVYDYINNIGGVRDKVADGTLSNEYATANWETYTQMTDQEVDTYNYIYNKSGKEAADEFLNFIQEDLNRRQAEENVANMNGVEKMLSSIPSGLSQTFTGWKQTFHSDPLPTSTAQFTGQIARNEVRQFGLSDEDKEWNQALDIAYANGRISKKDYDKNYRSTIWGELAAGAYGLGTVISSMAPSIMVSYVTGGLLGAAVDGGTLSAEAAAKIAGATGSLAMGSSAAGNAYNMKMKEGWAPDQARTYATLVGASEGALRYLLGGISKLGGGGITIMDKAVAKILPQISKLDSAVARFALEFGTKLFIGRGVPEFVEESLQDVLEPIFAHFIHGDKIDIDVGEAAYSGLMGFLAAILLEGGEVYRDVSAPRSLTAADIKFNVKGYIGKDGVDYFADCKSLEEVQAKWKELSKKYHPDAPGGNEEVFKTVSNQHDLQESFYKGFTKGKAAGETVYTGGPEAETDVNETSTERQQDVNNVVEDVNEDVNKVDLQTVEEAETQNVQPAENVQTEVQPNAEPTEQIAPTEEIAPAEQNELRLPGNEIDTTTEGGNINVTEPGKSAAEPTAEPGEPVQSEQTENAMGAPVQVPSGGRGGEPDVAGRSGTSEIRGAAWRVSGNSPEHKQIVRDRQRKAAAQMPTSAASRGIYNGSQNAWLRDYTEDMWGDDAEAREVYKKAEADGVKLSYVLGPIEIEPTPGNITRVDARVTPTGEMIIRADNPLTSISELYDHERLHNLVRKGGPEQIDNFAAAVESKYPDDWEQVYKAYEERYKPVTRNYAGMTPEQKARYIWEEVMGDAYAGKDNYGQQASKFQTEARDAVGKRDVSAAPQTAAPETRPAGTETETPEARGPPETNTTADRVEKYSLDTDTIDYAVQYTCQDETTKQQLGLLKDSLTSLADIQSDIFKEVGGRATQNIHTINEYLAAHPDVWQQLWDIQQNLADAGVRCDLVTAPGTPNVIDGEEVAGGLKGLPIEYVASTTGKVVKFSAFWRQMPQMMLDSMTHDARERLRTEIMKGVEDAYRRRVGETNLLPYFAEQFPTESEVKKVAGPVSAKNISNRTMPKVQAPLRSAEKTVMALNLNSACPMFTIGNNGCYLDACYLTQMANGATGTNLFRSAWYTGEILQIADSDIDLMNKLGGLRINGVGDTTLDNKSQLKDVIRHAGMRGLKLKMITKQRASLEVLAELYRSGVNVSHVTVQPSMDTLWIPAELDDVYGAGVRGTTQLADTVKAGNLDAAASGYEEMFGRATKIEDGVLYRKYGFSPEQIREMKEDFPFVQITPRYVVCTAAEIAEIALNRNGDYVNGGKVIQTLMHGKVPEGCTSDYPGELLNFGGARHVVARVDGQWKFYGEFIGKDGKVGKIVDGPNTPYGKVMAYVEANYTPQEQNKIWSTLRNQMCCQANDFKDACAGCQSLCARGCGAFSCEDFDYRKYTQKEKEAAMHGENDVRYAVDDEVEVDAHAQTEDNVDINQNQERRIISDDARGERRVPQTRRNESIRFNGRRNDKIQRTILDVLERARNVPELGSAGRRRINETAKQLAFPANAIVMPDKDTSSGQAYVMITDYGIPAFVISDEAWENDYPAFTRGGIIYIKYTLPDDVMPISIAYHELLHAIKQRGFAPYLEFIKATPSYIDREAAATKTLLPQVGKLRKNFPHFKDSNEYFSLKDKESQLYWDEFNAVIIGSSLAYEDFNNDVIDVFIDFDAYVEDLASIYQQVLTTWHAEAQEILNDIESDEIEQEQTSVDIRYAVEDEDHDLHLPTARTDELLGKGVYDLYANREPEATLPTSVPEGYESMDAYESAVEARAAAAQAERIRTISKDEFSGTDALDKLGVKIDGSVGNYSSTDELIKADRVAKQLQREIHKAELRLGATDAEKNFAAGMAAGIYSARDIPSSMNADVVEELADYYFAGTNAAKERLYQQKHNIERGLDEKMEVLFKDSDDYKPSRALTLNYRTPERNMLHIFGDKQGELINQAIFYPVAVNEAERFRFINRMHDEVRKFENKDGKQRKLNKNERALVQMVIEGRAAAESVAGMEMHESIENAAANILNGADPNDAYQEFSLSAEEQKAAVQYARWLQTQQMLDSGKYDTVKIENAVKKYSQLFGEFYDAINDFLVAHGYEPIGFIKGYAPHMQPDGTQTLLNKVFNQLGINTDVTRLPTSIAGLTANFKPNKRWNPYFLQRTGTETEYDIATGFESYVDYMSDVLYHTDDTMRVRAAARYFRRTYAPEEIKNNLSYAQELRYGTAEQKASFLRSQGELGLGSALTPAEIGEAMDAYVEKLLDEGSKTTKYSDLVMWLDNYANILAGKQSMADRSAESMFGRTVLNVGNRLTRAFAQANVAGSLSSMLNQSAQLPMIQAELGDRWVAAAIKDIVTGRTRKGEWMSQSDFLVGKAGIDYLVSTPGEMALSIMFKPAELMDTFVATVAVRGKYLQEIHNGKSHKEAMKAADRFGTSVMGSRMKGSKPVAFNSKNPLYQMVNVFQIEAFNSWEHIKEDLPRDFRRIEEQQGKGKATWTLASILVKGLLLAFLGNRLADKLYGGTPMPFDLIGLTANFIASGQGLTTNDYLMQVIDNACEKLGIDRIFDTEPEESEDFDWGAAVEDTSFNVMNDVPFLRNVSGLLGLGDQTLPMPDLYGGGKNIWQTFTAEDADEYDKARSILEFMSQFMPGGRQVKKSALGAETVLRGGDFSGRGENRKLKYPIDGDTWTDIQAILFGKYATEASNQYYAAGNSPLSIKQTKLWQTMINAGADPQDIYNAILDYRALSKDEEMDSYERGVEQRDLLRNLDVSDDLKLQMYRELTSADSRTDKFEKIMEAGLSFDRVMDIYDKYAEIDQNEDAKAQAKATEFAKWLDKQKLSDKQKSTIRDQLKYWSIIPADASRYDKLTGAGLEPEDAYKLSETLSSLTPEKGADGISNMQQYRAIAASKLGENEKLSAIGTVMGTDFYTESGNPSQYAKMLGLVNAGLSIDQYLDLNEASAVDGYIRCLNAGEYGIEPETYIYYINTLPDFDTDGNGSFTQAEMTAAVSAIPDIDSDQRAVLWQISHKNWKPNNNPWSYSVGASVYDAINGETDELLGLELPS